MSKKHGAKRKHRRKAARHVLCASCRQPAELDPPGLLASLAASFNACEDAGNTVRLRHGIVMTRKGYVLPLKDGRWAARTLDYGPFEVPAGDDIGDGMDD